MTRAINHATFTQARVLTWPKRWEEARNTWSEKDTLLEIAAEEHAINGPSWLFCAAYDAATRPDERDEHIARFEEELEAAQEVAMASDHRAAWTPVYAAAMEAEWL
jgi:hypothetical protein